MATATSLPAFNRSNFRALVKDGQIFSVEFIKRTDGSLRHMVCRLGVKKHLKGGSAAYDAKEHDLLTVFDMERAGIGLSPWMPCEASPFAASNSASRDSIFLK